MDITVVSCVNDFEKYDACVRSSFAARSDSDAPELIAIDNTLNNRSAPAALNEGLSRAGGEIVVLCHQDVAFPKDWTARLGEQISVVEERQKNWGVLGTFGIAYNGSQAGHIIDWGVHFFRPPLPIAVQSLDEHCLIVRKDAGLRFDEDLGGFHFYGADICLQALSEGLTNYAIDACLEHRSPGKKLPPEFHQIKNRLYEKWSKRPCPLPVIETTCKLCRLRAGMGGRLAYEIALFKRKRRRKRTRRLRQTPVGQGAAEPLSRAPRRYE